MRRLDRVLGFPEEGALMLRNYEHALLGGVTTNQLLRGLAKVLTNENAGQDQQQALLQFQKIVSHFYLVGICYYTINLYSIGKLSSL